MGKLRAKQNYAVNRNVYIEEIINNQHVRPASDLRFGIVKTSHHGSGWVSVYNVLYLLSRNISPAKVIRSIEEIGGTAFGGLWGMKYHDLISVLSEYGYMSHWYTAKSDFNSVVQVGATGILAYRTMRSLGEYHYVAFRRVSETQYDFYNPTTQEPSLEIFLGKRHAIPSSNKVIVVKNRAVKAEAPKDKNFR